MAPAPPPERIGLPLEEALALACERRLSHRVERVSLHEAMRRVLAEPVFAEADDPRFDASAMDGWAVRAEDGAAGSELRAMGAVLAGDDASTTTVERGCAVRITTGAEVPAGTDLIAPVEIVEESIDDDGSVASIRLLRPAADHIRRRGENVREGEQVLAAGTVMTPPRVALAATMGVDSVATAAPFEVAILPTGDEVVPAGTRLGPGQIHESNAVALAGALARLGHRPRVLPIVGDDLDATRAALDAASTSDVILTSGGVSMGEADHVRTIMEAEGEIDFWRIAMKPGGPPLFGVWRGTPLFGLPGNPVSTQVVFALLVQPWLAAMQGAGIDDPDLTARRLPVTLGEPFRAAKGRRTFHRVRLDHEQGCLVARAPTHQGSGNSLSMALADALLDLPPGADRDPGGEATALLLD